MSQGNVELFRKGMGAFLLGDIEPLLETSHPEIEWYPFSAQVRATWLTRDTRGSGDGGRTSPPPLRSLRRPSTTFATRAKSCWRLAVFAPGSGAESPWTPKLAGYSASATASPCGAGLIRAMRKPSKPPGFRSRRCRRRERLAAGMTRPTLAP